MSSEDPLLSMENVDVEFEEQSYVRDFVPDSVMERLGVDISGPVQAVDDASFEIGENECLAIVGESGSGKTTLGKTAIGLQRPTDGTVRYRGDDVWEIKDGTSDSDVRPEGVQRALQIIHQDPGSSLNPYRKVKANLSEPLKRWNPELNYADREERLVNLLERTGVTPPEDYLQRYPHQLSGGEQQRIVLIRAMLMHPDLIFADEAVSALDPSLRVDIMDLMHYLQEVFETSFLFVSHSLADARYFTKNEGDRIAVMYLGRIVEIGPSEKIINDPQHPYTRVLRWASAEIEPDKVNEELRDPLPVRDLAIPNPTDIPDGCRFNNRCPYAKPVCEERQPDYFEAGNGPTLATCFRADSGHEYWSQNYVDDTSAEQFENTDVSASAD